METVKFTVNFPPAASEGSDIVWIRCMTFVSVSGEMLISVVAVVLPSLFVLVVNVRLNIGVKSGGMITLGGAVTGIGFVYIAMDGILVLPLVDNWKTTGPLVSLWTFPCKIKTSSTPE